jgi:hypothetical protein
VEHVSPIRLVHEHTAEHRFSFDTGLEELKDLLNLVADDGVEDHGPRIRRQLSRVFGLFGRLNSTRGECRKLSLNPEEEKPNGA